MSSEIDAAVVRRLIAMAYDDGWVDACQDHLTQRSKPDHPIGTRREKNAMAITARCDPRNLLGLLNDRGDT